MPHDHANDPVKADGRGASDVAWLESGNRPAREDYRIGTPLRIVGIEAETGRTERKSAAVAQLEAFLVADGALREKAFGVHLLPRAGADDNAVRKFVPKPDHGVRVDDRLRRTARKRLFVSAVVRHFRAVA